LIFLNIPDIPLMLLDAVGEEDNMGRLPEAFSCVVDEDSFPVDSFRAKRLEVAFDLHLKPSAVVEPLPDFVVDNTHSDHLVAARQKLDGQVEGLKLLG
jgi:hypothetical protein